MLYDPIYWLVIGVSAVLSMWAAAKVRSAMTKYSRVRAMSGLTGAQAAKRMLDQAGVHDVEIKRLSGAAGDHYNPMNKTLALAAQNYDQPSITAVGVACHEAGHAIQHAKGYKPMWLRSILVKPAAIGSRFGIYAIIAGLIFGFTGLTQLGVVFFAVAVLFQLVTLPVEFDASARAKQLAVDYGIVSAQERQGVDKVLNAAAMTYVAAAAGSIMQLLYWISVSRD